MRLKLRKIRSLRRDEQGNVIAIVAVGLPVLVACAGLAVDGTQWVLTQRQAQAAADAAAIAGVHALIQGVQAESGVVDFLERDKDLPDDTAIQIDGAPDGFAEDPFALAVKIDVPARTSFSAMFLDKPFSISAKAIATVVETGEYCAFALGAGDRSGLIIEPGSSVEMDCGIATNSSSPQAILADSSSTVVADRITSYGGTADANADFKTSRVRAYGLKQKDPFAQTDAPVVPGTGCPNATVNAGATAPGQGQVVLKPGCYGNIIINGKARLEPGEYILNRGNLIVGPTGHLSCRGCAIFLTSQDAAVDPASIGKVRIHEHATVKLSAPTHGRHAGILLYQDRRVSSDLDGYENRIGGSSFSKLEGLIYFPSDTLRVDARMSPDLDCARLIGKRLILNGRVLISKGCGASGMLNFAGTEVRLVG